MQLNAFIKTVQHNCAISDARYARDYTLCIYLLRMREYYRWRHNIPLGEPLQIDTVGNWVTDRETEWDLIEEQDYQPLPLLDKSINPFDSEAVNEHLRPSGLTYSAGYGRLGQPHFVLAKHLATTCQLDITCVESGSEIARDSITQPAMAQGNTVYIRHECISGLLWQMLEEWRLTQTNGPMARLVTYYALNDDCDLNLSIRRAAKDLSRVFLEHEHGEIEAGKLLGPEWDSMAKNLIGTPAENYIRAVRDLYADSLRTIPMILHENAAHYLDFWLASVHGIRQQLLGKKTLDSLRTVTDCSNQLKLFAAFTCAGSDLWRAVANAMLDSYSASGVSVDFESITLAAVTNASNITAVLTEP